MKNSFFSNLFPSWTRSQNGENFYDLTTISEWYDGNNNLSMALDHPILTPALLFVSKIYSQAEFHILDVKNNKKIYDHWSLSLLREPNFFQTGTDFLETLMFMQIAQGVAIVYKKKIIGFNEPDELFILDKTLIEWPNGFRDFGFIKSNKNKIGEVKVKYDINGENIDIKIKDLMFFYDLPNCLQKNKFEVKSRIDGLKQTLVNTHDSLLAKNIILKTNGKELISGEKSGFPLSPEEKIEAESLFNNKYGLGFNRKRGIITKASLNHKSLHIALRDLGLDESVKVDGNMIYTALHIPKDILSLEAKKTTYNNFKESMVSYLQNEMQSSLDATTRVFDRILDNPNLRLKGDYKHLPIMQYILIEKYDGVSKRAKALNDLLKTGIPKEVALELCDFDKNLKLEELQEISSSNNNSNGEQQENQDKLKVV